GRIGDPRGQPLCEDLRCLIAKAPQRLDRLRKRLGRAREDGLGSSSRLAKPPCFPKDENRRRDADHHRERRSPTDAVTARGRAHHLSAGSLQATPGHADGDHHELERRWKKATFPNARPLRKSRFEDELGATSPALPRRARQPVPKSRDEVVVRQLILPLSVRRRVRADVIDRALDRSDEVELAIEDLEETIESPVPGVEPALVPELGVAPAASLEVDPGRREESLEDRLRRPLERLTLGDGGPRTEAPVEELDDDALLPTELLERLGHPRVIAKHLREHAHLNAGDLAVLRERFDDGVEKLAHLARRQAGRDAIVRPSEELEHAPRVIPREEIDEPDVLAFDHRRLERMEEPRRREPKIVPDEKDSRDALSSRPPQRGKELGALDLAASSMEPLLRLVDHEEHPRS